MNLLYTDRLQVGDWIEITSELEMILWRNGRQLELKARDDRYDLLVLISAQERAEERLAELIDDLPKELIESAMGDSGLYMPASPEAADMRIHKLLQELSARTEFVFLQIPPTVGQVNSFYEVVVATTAPPTA